MDDSDQQMQAAKEEETRIEELDMVSNKTENPMDPTVVPLPKKLIGLSKNKPIITVSSQEDPFVNIPHIGFIFGDQQWKLED